MVLHDLIERLDPNQTSFTDFDDMFEYLINACRPALQQCPTPLYRGMSFMEKGHKLSKVISTGTRVDNDDGGITWGARSVTDYKTSFNNWMVKNFNYKYLTEGIFTSGKMQVSKYYGEIFIVLPIGKFEFVWSKHIEDQCDISIHINKPSFGFTDEKFTDLMDSCEYSNTNLSSALKSGHEIILNCDRYIHISKKTLSDWDSEYTSLEDLWADLRG